MDKKIATLLYNNLRVIIPGFGAFIIRQQNPNIIVFNETLKNNDGLLLESIINTEGIEPDIAAQLLSDFTSHAVRTLESGGILHIEEIGTLRKDRSGNIRFTQEAQPGATNFNEEQIIRKPHPKPHVVNDPDILHAKFPDPAVTPSFPFHRMAKWGVIVLCANLIVIAFFAFKDNIRGALNPKNKTFVVSESVMDQIADSIRADAIDTSLVSAEKQLIHPDTSSRKIRYYIVAGCFRDEINADELVRTLNDRGFKAEKFGRIGDLFAVSYGSYDDKDQAVKELEKIRSGDHPDAWMTQF